MNKAIGILQPKEGMQLSPEAAAESFRLVSEEIHRWQTDPPGGKDPYCMALNTALTKELQYSRDQNGTAPANSIAQIIAELSARREVGSPNGSSPSEVVGVIRTIIVSHLLRLDPTFPSSEFKDPKRWEYPLAMISRVIHGDVDDPENEILTFNLSSKRGVQTSVASRIIPLDLLLQTMQPLYPDGYTGLHVGTSVMQGEQQLLKKQAYPYDPVSVVDPRSRKPNVRRSAEVNRLLTRHPDILGIYCCDLDTIYDQRENNGQGGFVPSAAEWAEGSRRIEELADPKDGARYKALGGMLHPKIHFKAADITDAESMRTFAESFGGLRADYVYFSTVFHQLMGPEERRTALRIARSLLKTSEETGKEDGFIVITDFMHPPRPFGDSAMELEEYTTWHDKQRNNYKTYLFHSIDDFKSAREIMGTNNSRVERFALGRGKIPVSKTVELSVPDAIQAAIERLDS